MTDGVICFAIALSLCIVALVLLSRRIDLMNERIDLLWRYIKQSEDWVVDRIDLSDTVMVEIAKRAKAGKKDGGLDDD